MIGIAAYGSSTVLPLPVLTEEQERLMDSWYNNSQFPELLNPVALQVFGETLPQPRIGSLLFPVIGACRFAAGVFAIDGYTLGLLRTALGSTNNRVTLHLTDDPDDTTETSRTVDLYLIACRAVSRELSSASDPLVTAEGTEDDLFLITLVDRRWYWNKQYGNTYYTTWSDILNTADDFFDAATLTIDSVHADYDYPGQEWYSKRAADTLKFFPLSALLDIAATNLQMRIVCSASDIRIQSPSAANLLVATDWFASVKTAGRFGGGGPVESTEELKGLPKTIRARWDDDTTETVTLSSGVTNAEYRANISLGPYSSSSTKTTALTRWATDFYAWQQPPLDIVVDGFVLPPHSGYVGAVEWFHNAGTAYTRVSRPPPLWGATLFLPRPAGAASVSVAFAAALATYPTWTDITSTVTLYKGVWHVYGDARFACNMSAGAPGFILMRAVDQAGTMLGTFVVAGSVQVTGLDILCTGHLNIHVACDGPTTTGVKIQACKIGGTFTNAYTYQDISNYGNGFLFARIGPGNVWP